MRLKKSSNHSYLQSVFLVVQNISTQIIEEADYIEKQ